MPGPGLLAGFSSRRTSVPWPSLAVPLRALVLTWPGDEGWDEISSAGRLVWQLANNQPRINAKHANHIWFFIRVYSRNSRQILLICADRRKSAAGLVWLT